MTHKIRHCLLSIVALSLVLTVSVGCGTLGGGSQFQNTVYDTHNRVRNLDKNLQGSVDKLNQTAAELVARVDASDQQMRTLETICEDNQRSLKVLQDKLDTLSRNLYGSRGLSQGASSSLPSGDVSLGEEGVTPVPPAGSNVGPEERDEMTSVPSSAAPVSAPPAPAPAPAAQSPAPDTTDVAKATPVSSGSAETDLREGMRTFAKQDYSAALTQFNGFLQRYPNSESCPDAQFWKAKSLRGLEKYEEAVTEFDVLRKKYPTSARVPVAMHEQAVCYARLGQTARAVALLQQVIKEYPMHAAADQSKQDLKKLQSQGN